jgi:hypothetical protein
MIRSDFDRDRKDKALPLTALEHYQMQVLI